MNLKQSAALTVMLTSVSQAHAQQKMPAPTADQLNTAYCVAMIPEMARHAQAVLDQQIQKTRDPEDKAALKAKGKELLIIYQITEKQLQAYLGTYRGKVDKNALIQAQQRAKSDIDTLNRDGESDLAKQIMGRMRVCTNPNWLPRS